MGIGCVRKGYGTNDRMGKIPFGILKKPKIYKEDLYKKRHWIQQVFKIKGSRRVVAKYNKT